MVCDLSPRKTWHRVSQIPVNLKHGISFAGHGWSTVQKSALARFTSKQMSPGTGQTKHRKVNLCNYAIYWFSDVMQWSLCKNLSHSSTYKPLWQYSILLWGTLKMSCWKSLIWPIGNKYAPSRMPVDTPGLPGISYFTNDLKIHRWHPSSWEWPPTYAQQKSKASITTSHDTQSSSWSDWDISSLFETILGK